MTARIVVVLALAALPAASFASRPAAPAPAAAIVPRAAVDLVPALAAAAPPTAPADRAAHRLAAGDAVGAVAACRPVLATEPVPAVLPARSGSASAGPAGSGPATGGKPARPGATVETSIAASPAPEDAARCRLVAGLGLLRLDRPAEAATVLDPARTLEGPLAPWAAVLHGEALAAAGDPALALAALEAGAAADPSGPLGDRALPAKVLALSRAGKRAEARAAAKELGSSRLSPRLALLLADAEAAAGDRGAVDAYRTLWRAHPESPEATRAEARLAELAAKGVPVPAPTAADRLLRADRLLDGSRLDAAETELALLAGAGLTGDARARLVLLEARLAVGRGHRAAAEERLRPLVRPGAKGAHVAEALELAARLAMRRGDLAAAVAHLDRLAADFDGRTAEEAAYLAAFFLHDAGKLAEAEARFRAFVAERPRSRRADEAAWWAGWSLYLQGRYEEAATAFGALAAAHPRSKLGPQVRYWHARSLERAGKAAEARALYRAVARDDAPWYALLAGNRLGRKAGAAAATPPGSAPDSAADVPLRTALARARLARAAALWDAGLPDLAGPEFDAALRGEKRYAALEAAARLAYSRGDVFRAYRLGLRLPAARAADLHHPRPWAAEVERATAGTALDPHFVWAIMRRESAFQPTVRSHAAAVGLMQLLPKTARRICEVAGIDLEHAARLGEPAVNVALGSWYLAELLRRFDGSVALAAASYNAGPEAVVRWLGERKGLALDEFVESIPYRETRHYVKHVVGDLSVYRRASGEGPPRLAAELPAPADGVTF